MLEGKIKCKKCKNDAISIIEIYLKDNLEKPAETAACCLKHEQEVIKELEKKYKQLKYDFYITDIPA